MILARVAGTEGPESVEAPDPVPVAIPPVKLQTVPSALFDPVEAKRFLAQRTLFRSGNPTEQVRLSGAGCTGAMMAKMLETVIRLVTVLPDDYELLTEHVVEFRRHDE